MTQYRDSLSSLSDTLYYHCISRCVRRVFLCSEDKYSGQSFEHRRQWIVERIRFLTDIFPIEVCDYSIMSNHYHLVLYVNEEELYSVLMMRYAHGGVTFILFRPLYSGGRKGS